MKNFCTVTLLLIWITSFAQEISVMGKLVDARTKEPIFSASVAAKDLPIGSISNDEGVFQLTVPKSATIAISCIGYETTLIPVGDFGKDIKIISVEPSAEMLEEIIVSKLPPQQLLEFLFKTSKARLNRPIKLEAYYREFVKNNGTYRKFSDGNLEYHVSGTSKKSKADIIVKQSRALDLSIVGDYNPESLLSVKNGVEVYYNFSFPEAVLLKKKKYKDYDFTLKKRRYADGSEMMVVVVSPKDNIQKALYEGEFIYDPDTMLIYDFSLEYASSHKKYADVINLLIARMSISESKVRATYKMTGNNYTLAFNNRFSTIKVWNKKRYDETIEARSDLIVTNFEKDDLTYDKEKVYKRNSLYWNGNEYTEKFWQKNNAIVLTAEEEKIIAEMEKLNTASN